MLISNRSRYIQTTGPSGGEGVADDAGMTVLPGVNEAFAAKSIVTTSRVRLLGAEMKRFIIPLGIVLIILVGLALLTEGSAIAPFLYRNF
jgi:hypothetical protein